MKFEVKASWTTFTYGVFLYSVLEFQGAQTSFCWKNMCFLCEDKIFGAVEFVFQTAVHFITPQLEVTRSLTTRVIPENSPLVSASVQKWFTDALVMAFAIWVTRISYWHSLLRWKFLLWFILMGLHFVSRHWWNNG